MSTGPVPGDASGRSTVQFSLFEGDWVNRIFAYIGLGAHRISGLVGRIGVLVILTWVPLALLAVQGGLFSSAVSATNFFVDVAAYAQFLVGLPLFVVAESVVSKNTIEAARAFATTGTVSAGEVVQLDRIHREIAKLRKSVPAELACVVVAYLLAAATLVPEIYGVSGMQTWHTSFDPHPHFTAAGAWELLVALPLLNYWWLRWVWKICIWCWYLYRVSRLRLVLVASHPDLTGGIGFVSEVQGKFALVILAYGISNVAATVGYKIAIEGAQIAYPPVWGPLVGFVIGAPLLFTVPLFVFTKQLYRTKRRALELYRVQATERAISFEKHWLKAEQFEDQNPADIVDLAQLNAFSVIFERVHHMRVVPFDLRSMSQLISSTLGSVATLLPLLHLPEPLEQVLKFLERLFSLH